MSPTTFEFPKPMEEVSDPVILPKDWYNVVLKHDPVIRPNGTLREAVGESADDEVVQMALEKDPKVC